MQNTKPWQPSNMLPGRPRESRRLQTFEGSSAVLEITLKGLSTTGSSQKTALKASQPTTAVFETASAGGHPPMPPRIPSSFPGEMHEHLDYCIDYERVARFKASDDVQILTKTNHSMEDTASSRYENPHTIPTLWVVLKQKITRTFGVTIVRRKPKTPSEQEFRLRMKQ